MDFMVPLLAASASTPAFVYSVTELYLHHILPSQANATATMPTKLLDKFDTNGDVHLVYNEFVAWWSGL